MPALSAVTLIGGFMSAVAETAGNRLAPLGTVRTRRGSGHRRSRESTKGPWPTPQLWGDARLPGCAEPDMRRAPVARLGAATAPARKWAGAVAHRFGLGSAGASFALAVVLAGHHDVEGACPGVACPVGGSAGHSGGAHEEPGPGRGSAGHRYLAVPGVDR